MGKKRIIQWTTGKVGEHSLRAILDDPRLELVGVYAYSPEKVGVDAGKLCGRPVCGIAATDSISELLSLNSDTVIYTPFMADLDHVVGLLESGVDVISTNQFLNVGGLHSETGEILEAACLKGGSSLYVTGVNPGWANSIAVALTATCRRVDSVTLSESVDCSSYQSPETWQALGMSSPEPDPSVTETAKIWLSPFRDAVQQMADSMELKLDDISFSVEFAKAANRVDLGWFCMEQDTIAAVRGGWDGIKNGRKAVSIRVNWYLSSNLTEGWQFDDDHYVISIAGDPDIETKIRFLPPDYWGTKDWEILTALPAVNSIFNIAEAKPGIVSLREAGLPTAPAGVWGE